MLRRIFAVSRYLILIAVLGIFLTSLTVFIYTGLTVVNIIGAYAHSGFTPKEGKLVAVQCIEIIDLFLIATVLYIIALGLFELFIDNSLPMPRWLTITSLDDLKSILIGVVTVLLAVTFLGNVVDWDGSQNILGLGIAVGVVLLALGFLLWLTYNHQRPSPEDESNVE